MMLPTALSKSWIYQMLPFIVSQDISLIGNKVPLIGNFTGVAIVNFIPDWESETVNNQSGLQTNSSEILF